MQATLWASVSGTKFLQTLPDLVTQLKGRYLAYLRAAVHRRCQRPPKGLVTNKKYCGSNITSKHARKHEARLPRVKKEEERNQLSLDSNDFGFICAGVSKVGSYKRKA